MKIYLASWPMKKDPEAAKSLLKIRSGVERKILLSYWYLVQENEDMGCWNENIPSICGNRERG